MHIFRRQWFSVLLTVAAFSLPFSAADRAEAYTLAFVSDFYGDGACNRALSPDDPAWKVAELVRDGAPDAVIATEVNNCNGTDAEYTEIDAAWDLFDWTETPDSVHLLTRAVPGNHDYYTSGADGFKDYFHKTNTYTSITQNIEGTTWKIIGLDSNLNKLSSDAKNNQLNFLNQELAHESAPGAQCSLVYFHHPRFSSGLHGSNYSMNDYWRILANSNVEALLSGHDHNYERFSPKNANGNTVGTDQGVVQVVAGTGGVDIRNTSSRLVSGSSVHFPTNSQDQNEYHGVLWVYLFETGYFAIFQSITGYAIDSWWSNCR
jgi:hypothetical protein